MLSLLLFVALIVVWVVASVKYDRYVRGKIIKAGIETIPGYAERMTGVEKIMTSPIVPSIKEI